MKSKKLILLAIAIFLLQSCAVQRRSVRIDRFTETFNGKTITEGFHRSNTNIRVGCWNFYSYDGRLNFRGSFNNNGLRVGKWVYEYDGRIMSELYFNMQGYIDSINTFHPNGQLNYKLRYTDGDNGFARHYHPNGNLKAFIPIVNGKIDGVFSIYFENGQLHRQTEFRAGARHSVLKLFDLQGNEISVGTFQEGTGHYIIYFLPEDGETALKVHRIYSYEDGEIAASKHFCRNGNITQITSYNEEVGKFVMRRFNEDGSLSFSTEMAAVASWQRTGGRHQTFALGYLNVEAFPPATFQSCIDGLNRFLSENIRYPRTAQRAGIQGRVMLQFTISPTGEIIDIMIMRSVSPELDAEAVRVVKAMPRWNPGFIHGVPARMRFTLPVNFQLQ